MDVKDILNTVICDDCLTVMRQLPDKCVDLVLTDPPYGIGFDYNGKYDDTEENLIHIAQIIFPEIIRISKLCVSFCNHKMLWHFPKADWIVNYTWNTTGSYGPFGICQWQPMLVYGKDIKGFGSVNGILKSDTIHI